MRVHRVYCTCSLLGGFLACDLQAGATARSCVARQRCPCALWHTFAQLSQAEVGGDPQSSTGFGSLGNRVLVVIKYCVGWRSKFKLGPLRCVGDPPPAPPQRAAERCPVRTA